ncbi:hypothetical protein KEM55_003267, partial [Ascosphaera atra]
YIFEELITAGDLFSFLEFKNGKLSDVETAVIVYQILKALEYLHGNNIVHRDLKPDNVLMTSLHNGYRIVLTDFGCAKRIPPAKRLMSVMGTAEYIAPEINRQKEKSSSCAGTGYTKAVDMWSLGCLTTVLLTGGSPFLDPKTMQYSAELASRGDIAALESDPDWTCVGSRAQDFVRRCLELDEKKRLDVAGALNHPWFSNKYHKEEFEKVYKRAVAGWRPRHRRGKGIMFVVDENGNKREVVNGQVEGGRAEQALGDTGSLMPGRPANGNGKSVHFADGPPMDGEEECMRDLKISDPGEGEDHDMADATWHAQEEKGEKGQEVEGDEEMVVETPIASQSLQGR